MRKKLKAGEQKRRRVFVEIAPDVHRQLKVEAAKRGMRMSDLAAEALNAAFNKSAA